MLLSISKILYIVWRRITKCNKKQKMAGRGERAWDVLRVLNDGVHDVSHVTIKIRWDLLT